MVWLDIVIYIVLIAAVVRGAIAGAVRRIALVAAVLIAFSESWRLSPWVCSEILPYLDVEPTTIKQLLIPVIAFALVFAGLYLVGRLVASFFEGGLLGIANRIAGMALGFVIAIYALGYSFSLFDTLVPIRSTTASMPPEAIDVRIRSELYAPIRGSITDLEAIRVYLVEAWQRR